MYRVTVPTIIDNGHFNREKTLAELKRVGAHRIALTLNRNVDAKFSTEASLENLRELIRYYEDNGIDTMVWLGETLGHMSQGTYFYPQYMHIRQIDGVETASFCPADPALRADFVSWIQRIARTGTKAIMLDDDFRLGWHRGSFGCVCDRHMALLSEAAGRPLTREELVEAVFSDKDHTLRRIWRRVMGDTLRTFAAELRRGLDEVDPTVRLGYCTCLDSWDSTDVDPDELAEIMAGGTKPFLRLAGAPYWTSVYFVNASLGETIEFQRNEQHWLAQKGKDKTIEIFSEGDTYPRPRDQIPAALLEGYDTALRADGTVGGILKYMLDYVSDADYETGYVDAMADNMPLYREIEDDFGGKRAVGVYSYQCQHLMEEAEVDVRRPAWALEVQDGVRTPAIRFGVVNSLPVSYEPGGCMLLFGENARHVAFEELKAGAVIDLTAARILMERGLRLGLGIQERSEAHVQRAFTDVPEEFSLAEGVYFRLKGDPHPIDYTPGEKWRLLTEYHVGKKVMPGWAEGESEEGYRFLFLPFAMRDAREDGGWIGGYAHRRILLSSMVWLHQKPLDAVTLGDHPMLYQLVKKGEGGLAVGVWNFWEDKVKNLEISVTGTWKNVRYINCRGHREGQNIVLDTVLYPYEFAGVLLTE